jgi:NhaP-type Na+/H+ or K+/H+ antiporter
LSAWEILIAFIIGCVFGILTGYLQFRIEQHRKEKRDGVRKITNNTGRAEMVLTAEQWREARHE